MAEIDRPSDTDRDPSYLPGPVDSGDIKAKFRNGVLEVKVPMPERRSERRTVKIDT